MISAEVTSTSGRGWVGPFLLDLHDDILASVGAENADLFQLFLSAYVGLLSDSPIDAAKPPRIIKSFVKKLVTNPKETIVHLASLSDRILRTMNATSDILLTGEFVEEMMKTPVFREYLHFFRTGDAITLRYLLSFLNFGKKLEVEDPELEPRAFRAWLDIERDLGNLRLPTAILDRLRVIIQAILGDFDDSLLLPKHGPGFTAEGFLDPNDKLDNLSFDAKARHVFRDTSFGRTGVMRHAMGLFTSRSDEEQKAKLRFVPKNVKTMRSICMEPIGRMYLQQEVLRWLAVSMERGLISTVVNLRDQEQSQQYALAGSACNLVDTIDLSAASDRLHVDIVRGTFPKQMLYYLLGTRTNIVSTQEGDVALRKFAPMGSALCFPVQCIVYTAITILASIMTEYGSEILGSLDHVFTAEDVRVYLQSMTRDPSEYREPSRHSWMRDSFLIRPRVFGDDISCDTRITANVLYLLGELGFVVNVEKSFIGGSPIRESCGVYAYFGVDVTPCLFRVKMFRGELNPRAYSSLLEQVNRLGDFKFHHARSALLHYLRVSTLFHGRVRISDFLPFTEDRSQFGIWTKNKRAPKHVRFNPLLQRDEEQALIIRALPYRGNISSLSEEYALDQWYRARVRGGSDESNYSSSRTRPPGMRFRLGWTPT